MTYLDRMLSARNEDRVISESREKLERESEAFIAALRAAHPEKYRPGIRVYEDPCGPWKTSRAARQTIKRNVINVQLKRHRTENLPPHTIILNEVARNHNIPVDWITGHRRKRGAVRARFELFYRLYTERGLSTTQIGKLYNRDHSTVVHAIHAHAERNNLKLPKTTYSVRTPAERRGETS